MTVKESSPSMVLLWRVTAAVAALLLIITVVMVVKVRMGISSSFTGTINNLSPAVYLRDQPTDTGSTVAILTPGTEVHVDRSTTREDVTWYHVRTESGVGWIPEANLSLSNP